ncbi:MAG: glycosyltransferase [Paludibacteraceae bacterium]|nr:glycosyltransferase [Paludibacteraceae bacterium]
MATPKLSIIVPIYNVEPYLRKCVESLLTQDLDPAEYEIILVDDGSTDGCPAICDEYAQTLHPSGGSRKGANIKVIHQPNGGLSAARNTGIMAAKGKFVQFVDSDDYLQPNVLRGLVEQMEREDLDVLRFDYQNVRINQAGDYEVFQPYKHPHQVDTRTDVVDGETYLNERMTYACYAWMFLIRREILLTNHLAFVEGILFEDTEWTPRMLTVTRRVNSTCQIVYNYLMRNNSITQTFTWDNKQRNIESLFIVNESLKKLALCLTDTRWVFGDISDNYYGILDTVIRYDYAHIRGWIRRLKSVNAFPFVAYKVSRNVRLKYTIINVSPTLYTWVMHIVYKKKGMSK